MSLYPRLSIAPARRSWLSEIQPVGEFVFPLLALDPQKGY